MAASANWRCADCDQVNGPEDRSCGACDSTRRAATPREGSAGAKPPSAPRSPAKRPAPARPSGDWRCSKCDTNNDASDLSCIGCGTSWKAATKKPPSRKTAGPGGTKASGTRPTGARTSAPKRPTPKRSASPPPRTPRASAPPPTGATSAHVHPEGVFYPPPSTSGYSPTAPRPSAPYPPPAPAPPPYFVPHTPYAPPKRRPNGCIGCLTAIGLVFVLAVFADGCKSLLDSGPAQANPSSSPSSGAGPCPSRISAKLPRGDGAVLVEAFRTANKQITLCRTAAGSLYYFGEFSDRREPGIAMSAKKTGSGYEADNAPYRYVIHDGVVTIYESGNKIGQETLTPEPSPS
ncbi:hypothetical protein [Streptomyces sp. NBC_00212]|uniref:hypothetical protein n=1 Tax=Streptomyces sp. NBC_00212 TaxID=2975684 RepID=UPI00324EE613